jgi:plastocyanin domain-containing protein
LTRHQAPYLINIANLELNEGFVLKIEPIKGIYFGNTVVKNYKGRGYLRIINTTSKDYEFTTPTMVIQEFGILTSLPSATCNTISKSQENRFGKIMELLRLEHLNKEEKKSVSG